MVHAVKTAAALVILVGLAAWPVATSGAGPAAQTVTADRCRVDGRVTSGSVALPGVSIGIRTASAIRPTTSTELDGRYAIAVTPNATYHLVVDFTGFTRVEREVAVGGPPCDQHIDIQLALAKNEPLKSSPTNAATNAEASGRPGAAGAPALPGTPAARTSALPRPSTTPNAAAASGGRGGQPGGRGGQRFQTLNVQNDSDVALDAEISSVLDEREAAALLPSGFAVDSAQGDAIAISGSTNATNLNRGFMNERLEMIGLGQLDPTT
jgi:hypothetical protein